MARRDIDEWWASRRCGGAGEAAPALNEPGVAQRDSPPSSAMATRWLRGRREGDGEDTTRREGDGGGRDTTATRGDARQRSAGGEALDPRRTWRPAGRLIIFTQA